ncbi:MAG: hypothetical protein CMJ22_12610 [Phycisphaerae bacterium]|nr:hypothetical protein [Phycisphaerae bacterium]
MIARFVRRSAQIVLPLQRGSFRSRPASSAGRPVGDRAREARPITPAGSNAWMHHGAFGAAISSRRSHIGPDERTAPRPRRDRGVRCSFQPGSNDPVTRCS